MRPPGQVTGPLISLLALVPLWPLQCRAGDSTFGHTGGDIPYQNSGKLPDEDTASAGFIDATRFDFDGDQISVNLHPLSGHVLDDKHFRPSLTMDMHIIQFEDKKPPALVQTTLEHEEHPYVNLESIEPFLVEPVTCQIARPFEETTLELHFETDEGVEMAQQHWSADNTTIRFVVEGLHCFEAAGTRSVYHSTDVQFKADRKVVIRAEPLHAAVHWGDDWAHTFRMRSIDQPAGHRIFPRRSLDVTHDADRLAKRGLFPRPKFNFHKDGLAVDLTHQFGKDLGPRHQFWNKKAWYNGPFLNFTCLDCHARGSWKAHFDVRLKLSPFGNRPGCKDKNLSQKRSEPPTANATAFREKHDSIQPLIYAEIEAERIRRHRSDELNVRKLRKRGLVHHPTLQHRDLACSEDDPTFPICHEGQVPRALDVDNADAGNIDHCNILLRPVRAFGKGIVCAAKLVFTDHRTCAEKWAHDVKEVFQGGLKEYMKEFIKTHLQYLEVSLEVVEDIDLRFQLEIGGTVGVSFWFDLEFANFQIAPCPKGKPIGYFAGILWCTDPQPPIAPSFGWFLSLTGSPTGTSLSSLPGGHKTVTDPDTGAKTDEWEKIGDKLNPAKDDPSSWKFVRNAKASADAKAAAKAANKDAAPDGDRQEEQGTHGAANWMPLPTLDINPMRLELILAIEASINATLPGFHVTMPRGKLIWRPLLENKADRFQNSLQLNTEYLYGKLEISEPKVTIRMSAGPAFKFHLIPIDKEKFGDNIATKFALTGVSDPLAMGGHFQPIRTDHIFTVAAANDRDGCEEYSVKYELVIRTGMDAWVMVFFQRVADLSWIGTLQKSNIASEMTRGLWYSKRLHVECLKVHFNTTRFNEKMNKALHKLQEPIAKAFAKIGEVVSSKANRPPDFAEDGVQSWHPDSGNRDLIDMMGWFHHVDKSDPGLKWKECDSTHPGCNATEPFLVADMTADCPEEGMCDPWSTYYIPKGIPEAIQEVYNEFYRSHGGCGKLSDQPQENALDAFSKAVNYNSSIVVPQACTSTPNTAPIECPTNIPKAYCDSFNYNSSTVGVSSASSTLTSGSSTGSASLPDYTPLEIFTVPIEADTVDSQTGDPSAPSPSV